jgi:hypothetical protein
MQENSVSSRLVTHIRNIAHNERRMDAFARYFSLSDEDLLSMPDQQRGHNWLAHMVTRVPSYEITSDLADKIKKFRRTNLVNNERMDKLKAAIKEFPELLQAPFPAMMMEWGDGILHDELTPAYIPRIDASLIMNLPKQAGIRIYHLYVAKHQSGIFPAVEQDISYVDYYADGRMVEKYPFEDDPVMLSCMQDMGGIALANVLFLKSRASLLKLSGNREKEIYSRSKGEQALRKGKPYNKYQNVLSFDLSRLLGKLKIEAGSEAEARALIEEHIVMGHPKLRRVCQRDTSGKRLSGTSQMRWIYFSEHWRAGTEAEKEARVGKPVIAPRHARAVVNDPGRELVIPHFSAAVPVEPAARDKPSAQTIPQPK